MAASETRSDSVRVRPRLLDLFCGAGGAAMGYHRAGFEVVGVDIKPQPRYPFEFIQADITYGIRQWLHGIDAIHASPPCQAFSTYTPDRGKHSDLVTPLRPLLEATGLPYVIENVPGAPLRNPVRFCGSWFGLDVQRHRHFETNWPLMGTPCSHHWQKPRFQTYDTRRKANSPVVPIYGQGRRVRALDGEELSPAADRNLRNSAMGIDWMNDAELVEAIPPAYTELIGHQLIQHLNHAGSTAEDVSPDKEKEISELSSSSASPH